ncbi:pyridoxamine 5'-phosphate oxidase family protein [Arthrobacter sp. Z4-13]
MDHEELEQFLNEHSVARLASITEDGSPYVVPLVFGYTGSAILVASRGKSVWYDHLVRDPRVAVAIDEFEPPGRRVIIKDVKAELLFEPGHEQEWIETKRKIETKAQFSMLSPEVSRGEITKDEAWKLGAERADYYLDSIKQVPYALWSIPFEYPSPTVVTWKPLTKDGDLTGMWSEKYGKITKPETSTGEVMKGWMDKE